MRPVCFLCWIVFFVYFLWFGCQLVFGYICCKINLPRVELFNKHHCSVYCFKTYLHLYWHEDITQSVLTKAYRFKKKRHFNTTVFQIHFCIHVFVFFFCNRQKTCTVNFEKLFSTFWNYLNLYLNTIHEYSGFGYYTKTVLYFVIFGALTGGVSYKYNDNIRQEF